MTSRGTFFIGLAIFVAAAGGCAGVKPNVTEGTGASVGSGGHAGVIGIGGAGGSMPTVPPCVGLCTDFPKDPIFDVGVSHDAAGMFGSPSGSAGPCITEPEDRALFPNGIDTDWVKPGRAVWRYLDNDVETRGDPGADPNLIRISFDGFFSPPFPGAPCGIPFLPPVPLGSGNIVVHDELP